MEIAGYVLLTAAVTVFIYGILAYNRFVMLKHNVRKAWGNIDVLLKQRHDELPKLVATCKEYMKHEQDTLRKVVEARSMVAAAREATDIPALGAAEKLLRSGLGQLFALVENYPDLKGNETFHHLQSRITGLEHDIADRREFYNDAVNVNNVGIEQFPDLFIAKLFDFRTHEVLLFEAAEKTDVDLRYTELYGRCEPHPGTLAIGFRSGPPCVWYRYNVHRQCGSSWTPHSQGQSTDTFVLSDGTGQCIIDPTLRR